jgi:hypothetical protein
MRKAVLITVLAAAVSAATASADGFGPTPGELFGGNGVAGPRGLVRYVAVPSGGGTVLQRVRVRGGEILSWRAFRGFFGIPLVAFDGTTDGLSHDGSRLVLMAHDRSTTLLVVDPRTLRPKRQLRLPKYWAFDALSPDGSVAYLLQYLGVPDANAGQPYAVRALDLRTGRLDPNAVVDRREPDEKMLGTAQTRVASGDGRWDYTLYARQGDHPFVHALDTTGRRAFCVDLPFKTAGWIGEVRLRLHGGELLLRRHGRTLARVDTRTFAVRR